jgi:ribonuclease HI
MSESTDERVVLYTDGACKGNPGPGGWGVLLEWGDHRKELCGGESETTNNRMEITAVIEGLRALSRPCQVLVVTDSVYVKDGVTKWMAGWKRNGWRTAAKKPVKNRDLWEVLDEELSSHTVDWEWVKGHDGHPGNERADELANAGVPN